jgi:hypothetical protein
MLDQFKRLGRKVEAALRTEPDVEASLMPLRGATAQLLLATGTGATLEYLLDSTARRHPRATKVPQPLTWAPGLIGPLAAAAQIRLARDASPDSALAVDLLNAATVATGAALFILDLLSADEDASLHLAPVAFASAGLLALAVNRQEREIRSVERRLRRRAAIVERLVPRRRPKIEKVVVHV